VQSIKANKVSFSAQVKISDNMKDFLKMLLQYDQKKRLTWTDMYSHKLLQSADQNRLKFSLVGQECAIVQGIRRSKDFYSKKQQAPTVSEGEAKQSSQQQ